MSRFRILVFHRAAGYVHRSIPDAVTAVEALGSAHGFEVDATEDPAAFEPDGLSRYDAVVFVHTSGNVLPGRAQRLALEGYLARGGGFLGIHAAAAMGADVADEWPWFRALVGAAFTGHTVARLYCDDPVEERPGVVYAGTLADAPEHAERLGPSLALTSCERAVVRVEAPGSPAARGLRDGAVMTDEWYGFDENPRPAVRVVATVDEASYEPFLGAMGQDHPIVWWREFGGGRTVYNAMGHASAAWREDSFLASVAGGIELAAGIASDPSPA